MDAAAYFDRLLSGNGLSLHFTHTSDAEIPTLEFGLVRPPQYQWVTVLLQIFLRYNSPFYDVYFRPSIYEGADGKSFALNNYIQPYLQTEWVFP